MNNVLETYKVTMEGEDSAVLTVTKEYEDYAESPREFSEHQTTFYTFERRHGSPDKHNFARPEDWAEKNGFDMGECIGDLIKSMQNKGFIVMPVWRYEHSGVAYQASNTNPFCDPWDSGVAGFIYISRKDARNMLGVKRLTAAMQEKIIESLKAEVEEWSDYANGDVYCYTLWNEDGESQDCIGNVYGDIDIDSIFSEFGVEELKCEPA